MKVKKVNVKFKVQECGTPDDSAPLFTVEGDYAIPDGVELADVRDEVGNAIYKCLHTLYPQPGQTVTGPVPTD